MHSNQLHLLHFGEIQFIESLVIHSCDQVIISNDTFNNTVIQYAIKIIGVKNLKILSWAFRGIRKSPEQLFVQATTITYVPPNSFSELTHIKHIWFRNSTIELLATGAFSGLTDVNYIYFRDCLIRHIENGAFGSMRRIQHFFVRGNITIKLIGSAIFRNSTIGDVIFEDAHFNAPSDWFVGLKAANIQLINSIWNLNKDSSKFQNFRQKIGHFSINNSTIDLIALKAFRNAKMLTISNSMLKKITALKLLDINAGREAEWITGTKKSMESVTEKLEIVGTTINRIATKAFVNLGKFKNLKIFRCRIDVIEKNAFQGFQSNEIRIDQTQIDILSIASFAALSVNLFSWHACNLTFISSMAFQGAKVQTLRFSRCHIKNIMKRTFDELEVDNLILLKTKIYRCEEQSFSGAKVKKLVITGTKIMSGTIDSIFRDFRPIYFHARKNLFDCNAMQCDTNSLLLDENVSLNLPWYFQGNQCLKQEICRQPPEWTSGGVFCKSYHFLAKCFCANSKFAHVPDINSSILIIADCKTLDIDLAKNDKISSLHVFRTDALGITKIPVNLQIFEIFHTKIVKIERKAFLGLRMEKIELISTQIELIASESFVNFQLSSFILRRSTVNYVQFHAFSNSSVKMLNVEKSNFLHVFDFWKYFNNTTLMGVFVNLPGYLLEGARNLCLKEVTVGCECLTQQLALGIATSALIMGISVIAVIFLFSDINDLYSGVIVEMNDFKEIADDTWSKILSVRSNEFQNENGNYHGFENLILRAKRQYPSHCRCSASADRCQKGPPGPQGDPGMKGLDGASGDDGRPGVNGVALLATFHIPGGCIDCPRGPPGLSGPPGLPGSTGIPGDCGRRGRDGKPGTPGKVGPRGEPGDQGQNGTPGKPGRPGKSGKRGTGPPGSKGRRGPQGPIGEPGVNGAKGDDGAPGEQGQQGKAGKDGKNGKNGKDGMAGSPGLPGPDAHYCPCPRHGGYVHRKT
ncbi:unnamed protein product [Acanthocheilonema viteae]|uniref:Nematode cuticle collagen N-terminal domain-containing protein n=1 Tax=Acanthocheilonema viteae TaxID=6277 RepID=A0A498SCD4_ACAVI|nr:unnamed protein product [Acanthocheilonema viteae]